MEVNPYEDDISAQKTPQSHGAWFQKKNEDSNRQRCT